MKTPRYFLASLGLLGATFVHAYTGNELLADFEAQGVRRVGSMQYVRGVVDGITSSQIATRRDFVCIPERVTVGQITDVAINELQRSPANRHLDAGAIVYLAFVETWPCKAGTGNPRQGR